MILFLTIEQVIKMHDRQLTAACQAFETVAQSIASWRA